MAAALDVALVNITVNDQPLQVPKGELIVESVKRLGLEIPIFCYHPRMKPVGMCRMCLVEIGTKGPDGSVLEKAGTVRDGGSFDQRMGAVACWNAVMDENT